MDGRYLLLILVHFSLLFWNQFLFMIEVAFLDIDKGHFEIIINLHFFRMHEEVKANIDHEVDIANNQRMLLIFVFFDMKSNVFKCDFYIVFEFS